VILDEERGVLSATFQVHATGLVEAQTIGALAFTKALRAAGLTGSRLWEVVQATEEPGA
jgi:hypothetical protein